MHGVIVTDTPVGRVIACGGCYLGCNAGWQTMPILRRLTRTIGVVDLWNNDCEDKVSVTKLLIIVSWKVPPPAKDSLRAFKIGKIPRYSYNDILSIALDQVILPRHCDLQRITRISSPCEPLIPINTQRTLQSH